jgi:hypothetical protein
MRTKGRTEHSGSKKGKGAFFGKKKDAKRFSNRHRRIMDRQLSRVTR